MDFKDKQEKIKKHDEKVRERELNDIRKILGLSEGRRFMWRVLSEAGVFRSSFTGNSTTFFNEGKRSQGLWVLADLLEAKPEAFNQMQNEHKSEIKVFEKETQDEQND